MMLGVRVSTFPTSSPPRHVHAHMSPSPLSVSYVLVAGGSGCAHLTLINVSNYPGQHTRSLLHTFRTPSADVDDWDDDGEEAYDDDDYGDSDGDLMEYDDADKEDHPQATFLSPADVTEVLGSSPLLCPVTSSSCTSTSAHPISSSAPFSLSPSRPACSPILPHPSASFLHPTQSHPPPSWDDPPPHNLISSRGYAWPCTLPSRSRVERWRRTRRSTMDTLPIHFPFDCCAHDVCATLTRHVTCLRSISQTSQSGRCVRSLGLCTTTP
jgi:hypothetical protein